MALPKPSQLKIAEGNRSKLGEDKLKPDPQGKGKPNLPPDLAEDEIAMWHAVVASLPDGLLTSADDGILERYVVSWARFRNARILLRTMGMTITTERGVVKNPLLTIIIQANKEMHAAGGELGLSPVARARLAALDLNEFDPMSMLLGGAVNDN